MLTVAEVLVVRLDDVLAERAHALVHIIEHPRVILQLRSNALGEHLDAVEQVLRLDDLILRRLEQRGCDLLANSCEIMLRPCQLRQRRFGFYLLFGIHLHLHDLPPWTATLRMWCRAQMSVL
jgi:hypothetical protein